MHQQNSRMCEYYYTEPNKCFNKAPLQVNISDINVANVLVTQYYNI